MEEAVRAELITKVRNSAMPTVVPLSGNVVVGFGLTKREYLAGMFLQGDLAHSGTLGLSRPEDAVKVAFRLADALLAGG